MIGLYVIGGALVIAAFAIAADVAELKRGMLRIAAVLERDERRRALEAPDAPPREWTS